MSSLRYAGLTLRNVIVPPPHPLRSITASRPLSAIANRALNSVQVIRTSNPVRSMMSSLPRKSKIVSWPLSAWKWKISRPSPPDMRSSPAPPMTQSFPPRPYRRSSPSPPAMKSFPPELSMVSSPASPISQSFPSVPRDGVVAAAAADDAFASHGIDRVVAAATHDEIVAVAHQEVVAASAQEEGVVAASIVRPVGSPGEVVDSEDVAAVKRFAGLAADVQPKRIPFLRFAVVLASACVVVLVCHASHPLRFAILVFAPCHAAGEAGLSEPAPHRLGPTIKRCERRGIGTSIVLLGRQ